MSDYTGVDPRGLARLQKIGGPLFVRKMIDLFLEEAPDRLAAARRGEQAGDLVAVGDAAHSLKSSAQNFGAGRLSRIAGDIELRARANGCENLSTLLGEMEAAYSTAKAWLESERDALKI
jgi:HPt (histidine-containing phosphotransfer) domain-containing protein